MAEQHAAQRAADDGIAVAQYRLASLYERGQGVETDRATAAALRRGSGSVVGTGAGVPEAGVSGVVGEPPPPPHAATVTRSTTAAAVRSGHRAAVPSPLTGWSLLRPA